MKIGRPDTYQTWATGHGAERLVQQPVVHLKWWAAPGFQSQVHSLHPLVVLTHHLSCQETWRLVIHQV